MNKKTETINTDLPRIIAVDDDPSIITLLKHTLDRKSFEIQGFIDPRDALSEILATQPNIVITDLTMPGMTGLELIEQIRKKYCRDALPIIVLSALGDEEVILQCFASGATDYLLKPFGEGELKRKFIF